MRASERVLRKLSGELEVALCERKGDEGGRGRIRSLRCNKALATVSFACCDSLYTLYHLSPSAYGSSEGAEPR